MELNSPSIQDRVAHLLSGCLVCGLILSIFGYVAVLVEGDWPKRWPSENAAEFKRIRTEVDQAEARWQSHGIANYDIDINGVVSIARFCGMEGDRNKTTVQVRHGRLVMSEAVKRLKLEESCHVSSYLPPQVFTTVRQELDKANPDQDYLSIEFDPEYGFLSSYLKDRNSRSVADATISYQFTNFRPVWVAP